MSMGAELFGAMVGLCCTVISSLVTFFLTRRKYNTEVDSQKIQNMSSSFDVYKKMTEETIKAQDSKITLLMKENDSLRQQVSQLQVQMINILGSICLDATCKLRKMNFSSDIKFSDSGFSITPPRGNP